RVSPAPRRDRGRPATDRPPSDRRAANPWRPPTGRCPATLAARPARPRASCQPLRHEPPMTKQIHLAAHFPGVNNTTVWSDPAAGSHIEFDSFTRFAQTAERGKFDFMFLAEGLRLREQNGQIYDLD